MSEERKGAVWPVILSGGSGTRLWPKSRTLFPKQFHSLTSQHTLLQEALLRVVDEELYAKPIVVCGEDHRFIVSEQAEELGIKLQDIVLEPEGRNTAPAVAVAAALVRRLDPNGLVLVLASDHHIGDTAAFTASVRLGVPAAIKGFICTFGIAPSHPETGYGYIKRAAKEVSPGVFKIAEFKEKPDLPTAEKYVADPSYAWNAGLFLFSASAMLTELDRYEPSIRPACEAAILNGLHDDIASTGFLRLSAEHFKGAKAMSLDYAIMERTEFSGVIPMDAMWTDVGSWSSLYSTCLPKEINSAENKANGVFTVGDVAQDGVQNCYLSTDGPLLAAIGVKDLCVISTDDAVLVLPMNHAQNVGKMAKKLMKDPKYTELAQKHRSEYKPWGSVRRLASGERYKCLELTIKPGAATSLQMHFHRAMHQVVVKGTALVIHGGETQLLHENQSTFVPIGTQHRLQNPGSVPLVIMEVQSGAYLGNDDIVRLEDAHGRSLSSIPGLAQIRDLDMGNRQRPSISGAIHTPNVAPAGSRSGSTSATRTNSKQLSLSAPSPAPEPEPAPAQKQAGSDVLVLLLAFVAGVGITLAATMNRK